MFLNFSIPLLLFIIIIIIIIIHNTMLYKT